MCLIVWQYRNNRPPLSKGLLRGTIEPDAVLVDPTAAYAELEIDLRLEARVVAVDPSAGKVVLADGEELGYDRLVLATGSTPRRLGIPGEDLEGVFSYRTLDDALGVRAAAGAAGRVLIVGAGFIGMETAASLRSLGLEVTVIEPGERLFAALGHPGLSTSLEQLYRDRGVEILLGDVVTELHGEGSLTHATTREGRRIEAGLAIIGVGVDPSTQFLADARIADDPALSSSMSTSRRTTPASSRLATSRASTIRWPDVGD